MISQGDVCWAELPRPTGAGLGYRRPVVVVQGNALNRSRIATAICIPLTCNLRWAKAPGNVLLKAQTTGLKRDSVANVSQVVAIDRELLEAPLRQLSPRLIDRLLKGLDIVTGR